jgi:flagellar FliL protein
MAEEKTSPEGENAAAPAPAAAGGAKAWLPLIASLVLMPALAFGMTKFIIVPSLQKSLGIKETAEKGAGEKSKKTGDGKKINVPFNKLLVNIAGTMGQRYLLVSLSISSTTGEEFKLKVTDNEAPLRDMAMGILSTKTLADLEKPGARNLIRTELINGFNNILGDNSVAEIYITEFGIQ